MDLREAMEAVRHLGITAADLGAKLTPPRSGQLIRQAMLNPDKTAYRTPPPGWEAALVALVRDRCEGVEELVEQIKPEASR